MNPSRLPVVYPILKLSNKKEEKKMKKLLSLFLAVWMALALVSCSTEKPSAPPTQDASSSEGTAAWVPTKDIEFVIPFGAGGGNDVMVRKIVEIIGKNNLCPVNIVPVNKSGGSGVVGYTYLTSKGAGYEYSIASTSASFYTQPLTGNSPLTADENSFSFVAHMVKDPTVFVATPSRGFTSIEDVVSYAKEHPGELKWGGIGIASDDAIIMYMLNDIFDIELTYVPYDSGGQQIAALLGGHIDLAVLAPAEAQDHITSGSLSPLAVCADERMSILPDVPTFIESNVDMNHQQSRGIVMNPGVDEAVLDYYSDLFRQVSETPEWQEFLDTNFMSNAFMDHKEYAEFSKELLQDYTTFLELIPKS